MHAHTTHVLDEDHTSVYNNPSPHVITYMQIQLFTEVRYAVVSFVHSREHFPVSGMVIRW